MTPDDNSTLLTGQQKQDICRVITAGCDRESAAKYARTSWAAIRAAMNDDPLFAADVRFGEANAELHHMGSIHKAAENPSHWRASSWWLERLAPERYGPRGTGQVSIKQLKLFIEHISTTLVADVRDNEDRKRLLDELQRAAMTLEVLLRDDSVPENKSPVDPSMSAAIDDEVSADETPTEATGSSDSAEEGSPS